jgi:hypothetical protein
MGLFNPPTSITPLRAYLLHQPNPLMPSSSAPASTSLLASLLSGEPTPPSLLGGFGGLGLPAVPASPPHRWYYVRRRFTQFLTNITITDWQRQDGEKKQAGVRACLNRHYWGIGSETAHSMLIGSWGKDTRGRPSRDIDILFLLPGSVYWQYQNRVGNRQSQLLQEVKGVLLNTYFQTAMRADGQVICVPFNSIPVEVSIGFTCTDGSIIVCDTNNGGFYKTSTAQAEAADLDVSDRLLWNSNTRALVRMMKSWQRYCNVPLKSFHIERLAIEFLDIWAFSKYDVFYYDWMVRDFLAYLIRRANGNIIMPGTCEVVPVGSDWLSRAETAYRYAVKACEYEQDSYQALAGGEWQNLFGSAVPLLVP